jgi:hypothetical protein
MTKLHSHFLQAGNQRKRVAIATIYLIGFSHPKAKYFLLLRQKKVFKEKAARSPLNVLRSSHLSGDGKKGFLPLCRRAASLPHPVGLFPTNAAVLDAANGGKRVNPHPFEEAI